MLLTNSTNKFLVPLHPRVKEWIFEVHGFHQVALKVLLAPPQHGPDDIL